MTENFKTQFQKFHYSIDKINPLLKLGLSISELFYKTIINSKNFLYEKNILKEEKLNANIICIGNLTTGGVGKTPIVIEYANNLSKEKKVAIVSRGYGAKLSNKKPRVIKDQNGLKFENGSLCGDEPFQTAKKINNNVVVITCANRKLAIELAIIKYGIDTIILDDGFSNRKVKKDKTILVIDSKMRFGNNHLLPYGPLREPTKETKRADEIIIVNKGDEKIQKAITWAKNNFNLPIKLSQMSPKRIYNMQSGADIKLKDKKAIAFCAIGQPEQFFDFVKQYYEIEKVIFEDHHKYTKADIEFLTKLAKKHKTATLITTQKDEAKLLDLVSNVSNFSFNVLELKTTLENI